MKSFSLEFYLTEENLREAFYFEFREYEDAFMECFNRINGETEIEERFNVNLVGQFLIASWFGVLIHKGCDKPIKPCESFRAFIYQQLLN